MSTEESPKIATDGIVKIHLNNKTRSTRILRIIALHKPITIDGTEYQAFLGRRLRFNNDANDSVSTYGADHAYLVRTDEILVLR